MRDILVNHNTVFHTAAIIFGEGDTTEGLVFQNNIVPHNVEGITGTNAPRGIPNPLFPGAENSFLGNVIVGKPDGVDYPNGVRNFFPASLDEVRFVDLSGRDYHLAPTSPVKGKAADGTDPGCDVDVLEHATAGVIVVRI
jgi:hypothetical protein